MTEEEHDLGKAIIGIIALILIPVSLIICQLMQ